MSGQTTPITEPARRGIGPLVIPQESFDFLPKFLVVHLKGSSSVKAAWRLAMPSARAIFLCPNPKLIINYHFTKRPSKNSKPLARQRSDQDCRYGHD
jgi:hypothetical protein